MKRLFGNRRGAYYFVIDVFIGLFIFVLAIFIIASYVNFSPSSSSAEQTMDSLTHKLFRLSLIKTDPGNSLLTEFKLNNSLYDSSFTVDEFVFILVNHSQQQNASLLLENLTYWVPANVGFNYSLNGQEIYSRQTISKTLQESTLKLTQKKITLVAANITTAYDMALTELVIWQ